jgi:predicted nucleotidyltransferase component of viral defense system
VHTGVLDQSQLAVLAGLSRLGAAAGFYLAGGTALALRHGHRRSIDFDFFRPDAFDGRALTATLVSAFPSLELLPSGEQTLYLRLEAVTTSFFCLPYPLLEPAEPTPWGFGMASDRDIAAMKLEAIAGRGARKDFVDLWILCQQGLSMEEIFDFFERKYGVRRTERYHRLRALSYFADAEAQPMPDMLVPFDWERAKAFFASEAARLLSQGLGD